MRHIAFILSALVASSASVASAQYAQAAPGQPPPQQQQTMQAPQQQQTMQAPQQQAPGQPQQQQGGVQVVDQSQAQTAPTYQSRGLEYGAHIIVPIFLVSNSLVGLHPGIGIQGRIGWEFRNFTTELNIGAMINGSASGWDYGGATVGGYSMTNLWLGAGIRYAFLNPSAFVPFVGLGIALNDFSNAITVGGTTDSAGSGAISFGFNGLVGFAYELSQFIAFEAGAQINYTFQPSYSQIPAQPEVWLSPFIGGTLYY